MSPPAVDALPLQTNPALVPQDPGVVTPSHQSDTSFVDPLADVAAQLKQRGGAYPPAAAPLPVNGDLAGELSQVQQMMATTQQQQQHQQRVVQQPALAPAAPPRQPSLQPQVARPFMQPAAPNGMVGVSPHQQQPRKPAPAPVPAIARPPLAKHGMAAAVLPLAQPPNKRPRVAAPPPPIKGSSYSFAAAPRPRTNGAHSLPPPSQGLAIDPGNNRPKSQAQVDRRRERNRILARRTRLRKKFFFESLQKDVADLQRENAALKSIVRSRLKPDDARVILSQCNANEKLPSAIHSEGPDGAGIPTMGDMGMGEDPSVKKLDKEDFSLIQSIQNSQQCFIITDPSLHDNPIVYASDDFLSLTGYSQEEVLGRNCRFLQGTETCKEKVSNIRKAVEVGEDINVTFVNYTSDGKPFWNSLFIAALRDADNNIVNFIGVIVKVAGPEAGDSEYGKVLKA